MKKILYTRPDGVLCVVHPVRNTHPVIEDLTDQQILDRSLSKLPPDALDIHIVDESEIPADRTFRDAWQQSAGKIEHNLPKAKEIHKERLRHQRKPLLEALDAEYMKALEADDKKALAEVKSKKQALRDITKHPDLLQAASIEDLKKVTV